MIIDQAIRDLVLLFESTPNSDTTTQIKLIHQIIQTLDANCQQPAVQQRYAAYFAADFAKVDGAAQIGSYPLDDEGYAVGFDPLTQEQQIWDCWLKYGVTISQNVIAADLTQHAIQRMSQIIAQLSEDKFNIDDPATHMHMPLDPNGTQFISRGFMEVYHDDFLAQIRQSLRVYLHNVIIWGRADLWTTFDRVGVKLAGHPESNGLPLHVDQNALGNPHFTTVQGVLALSDCPKARGTLVVVPGSRALFPEYGQVVIANDRNYRGEYVELTAAHPHAAALQSGYQILPLRSGSLASWDSRNTHANSPNESQLARKVAYISSGVAREFDQRAIAARKHAFDTGQATYDHSAYMHVTKKPRFKDQEKVQATRISEQFSPLGALLYSQQMYNKIIQRATNKSILLNAENFGYGPTAAIADFFPELRKRFKHIAFIGSGHGLDLQRKLAYDAVYDLDELKAQNQDFGDVVKQYDVFMTASEFKLATIAAEQDIPTIIYDPLTWYWPEIPKVTQHKNVLYIAQEFLGVDERLATTPGNFALPYTVAPIVSQELEAVTTCIARNKILVNLGGLTNPYWPKIVALDYAQFICRTLCEILPADQIIIACNQQVATAVGGVNYTREQIHKLLPTVKLAFVTPGLSNIYDMAAHNIPTAYLPPINDSQGQQAQRMQKQGFADFVIDWHDLGYPVYYDVNQKEALDRINNIIKIIMQTRSLQEQLKQMFTNAYITIKSQTNTRAMALINKFGTGGKLQVAEAVQAFAEAYRPAAATQAKHNKKIRME